MYGAVVDDLAEMERLTPAWDALATAASRPYAAPGWQLSWWRRAAPSTSRPLLICARQGEELVGVLGLYEERTTTGIERLRLMGAPLAQGTGPLATPGREAEVARALASALRQLAPRPATLEFEGVLDGRRWATMLSADWPRRRARMPERASRPRVLLHQQVQAPFVPLAGGTLDDWLAGRSANFRQQMRRSRRRMEASGARLHRLRDPDGVRAVLPELLHLHRQRWSDRGGSQAVDALTGAVLAEAAGALGGGGRMHVEAIELDGAVISAHLFLTAGGESTYWLGGFDERFASSRPGLLALVGAVEHALELGASRLDLGPGMHPYKLRFADCHRRLDWLQLLLPGPRRPLTRLQLAPRQAARDLRGSPIVDRIADARAGLRPAPDRRETERT